MVRLPCCGVASVLVAAAVLVSSGCGGTSNGSPAVRGSIPEDASLQYRSDIIEVAAMIAQYIRQWETTGGWPEPGTYNSDVLIYKGTESGTPQFPDRRRDFYRTLFDGGRELDVIMYDDGRISVDVLQDREP